MSSENLLEILNLRVYYFTFDGVVKAVDNVSLAIRKGESLALVGESGCGKSTLGLSIMRLVPRPGRIVDGKIVLHPDMIDLVSAPESEIRRIRGKRIGMVFQDPMTYLNPVMKIGDQIAEGIMQHERCSREEARKRAIELLAKVRIPDPATIASYYPHQLSGGMRQRVVIAIAISCNPELLIADEPTSALDVTVQAQILDLIKELQEELNSSLLLITHDLGIVAETCDRVAVMYAGKIVEEADVYDLFREPKHPYSEGLLRAAQSIESGSREIVTIEGSVPDLLNPPPGCRFHPRCKYAMEKCKIECPPMIDLGNRRVACWLYA